MKFNKIEETGNVLQVFDITPERSTEIQDILEQIIEGDGSEGSSFTIKQLFDKSEEICTNEQELGFCCVCIGRYIGEAMLMQNSFEDKVNSILDLINQGKQTPESN